MSIFVKTTIPEDTPSKSRIRKCSSDWGFHPSLAAITKIHESTVPTPASIFLINLSWPGTSIKETVLPLGSVNWANPKSMVNPRSFSSTQRSGSVPVKA